MPESDLLKKVQEMLNEEKWTRAALGAYSVGQFKELDQVIGAASEANVPRRSIDFLRAPRTAGGYNSAALCDRSETNDCRRSV